MDPALVILLWQLAFLLTHLIPSHPPVRAWLVGRLGTLGFLTAYSLLSFVTFVPPTLVWWENRHGGPELWHLRELPGVTHGAELLALLGFALLFGGVVKPPPSSLTATMRHLPVKVAGMTRITRHPLFMGLSLWAVAHLLVNGNATDVAFWGGFPVVTLVGCLHQDWRKAQADPAYAAFVKETSFLPFGNWLRGQVDLAIGAPATIGALVGVVVALVIRSQHDAWFR